MRYWAVLSCCFTLMQCGRVVRSRCYDFGYWLCDVVYGRPNTMRSNTIQCSAAHSDTIQKIRNNTGKCNITMRAGLPYPIESNTIQSIRYKTKHNYTIQSEPILPCASQVTRCHPTHETHYYPIQSNPTQSHPVPSNTTQYIIIRSNPAQYCHARRR